MSKIQLIRFCVIRDRSRFLSLSFFLSFFLLSSFFFLCFLSFFLSFFLPSLFLSSLSLPQQKPTNEVMNPEPNHSLIQVSNKNASIKHIRIPEAVARYHTHGVGPNKCCSSVTQEIAAPVSIVWSVVRRFDNPQAYKHFVKNCHVIVGDGDVGTLREVQVISGLPANSSTERLDVLDEESHIISFSMVGEDHRLSNYKSVTTLHPSPSAGGGTVVVESYVVDVPAGNTKEDTCNFVDTIMRCNLQSLAQY